VKGTECSGKDCDDTRAGVFPGAPEVCNARDDDCNGQVDEGCMASPDTCDSALTVMLSEQGTGVIEGSFGQLEPNHDVTCGAAGAADAVYLLELQGTPVDVVLETAADSAELVLAAGASCGNEGFRTSCAKPLARGATRLVFHSYQGNELFILVDARSKTESGSYRVNVSVTPAASDGCSPTAFDYSGCGTLVGFMPLAAGQLLGSCQAGGIFSRAATEAVFRVVAPDETLNVRVASDAFAPSLYTRDGCGTLSSELDCDSRQGGSGEAKVDVEPSSGTVYVVVDGASAGASYTLTCGP
jgi:hypothetical protein